MKVEIRDPDDCWPWKASLDRKGYGQFSVRVSGRVKMLRAHRVSWKLVFGEISDGQMICHRCDNPKCVNPGHLFSGTQSENIQDMIAKGRGGITLNMRGKTRSVRAGRQRRHYNVKVSQAVVSEICRLRGTVSAREAARRYGISAQTVYVYWRYGGTVRHTRELQR